MIKKIRRQFEEIRGKKHYVFDDLDPTIRRCLKHYGQLFPNHKVTKDGSRVAYHFGVEGVGPITVEKEHGSREYLPPHYAKRRDRTNRDLAGLYRTVTRSGEGIDGRR
jgi:hypothetical protein